MTTISGADVERLRELGGALRGSGEEITAIRSRLGERVPLLLWAGPDRERFAHDWLTAFAPALAAVAEALGAAATEADQQAAQQEGASSAGGSGRAGGGVPGAGAGAGAGAGTAEPGAAAAAGGGGVGTDRYGNPTGELSARYESRGDAGTVSTGRGDPGGISYGTYQLATNRGTPGEFVAWSREHYPEAHERLASLTPGTAAFGTAWRELATADPAGFGQAQHDFVVATHHQPGVDRIVARVPAFTLEGRDDVVADVVWSTTVQHGAGGAGRVFANALHGQDVAAMSDADLVRAIYTERGRDDGRAYFPSSSAGVRDGVVARFVNEQADALRLLGEE